MKKGLAFLLFAGVLFITTALAGDEPRPVVAVFEIQDIDAQLEPEFLVRLTDYLGIAISEGEVYRVVPPDDVRRAWFQKKTVTYTECHDRKCQIDICRDLAADKALSTSITRMGGTCVVTSSMYDLKTQTTEVSAEEHGPCANAGLGASVDKVAFKLLYWASRGEVDKELEITSSAGTETVVEPTAEVPPAVEVMKPASVKKKYIQAAGSVADALLAVGMSTNVREGLHPRHVSDTEYGLRIDGRFFLGSLVDNPILKGIGVGGYFNKVFNLKYGIPGGESWDTSQHQWQVEVMYRLALNDVILKPAFILRTGYGGTSCIINTEHPLALSASYGYPYAALDVYLMIFEPYIRLYVSAGYLFTVALGEDLSGSGSGYTVRAGLDLAVLEQLHVGLGYDLLQIAIDDDTMGEASDTYRGLFFRAGWSFL